MYVVTGSNKAVPSISSIPFMRVLADGREMPGA
jgi:hypothetical protein